MTTVLIFDTETSDKKDGEIIEAAWLEIQSEADPFGCKTDTIQQPFRVLDRYHQRFQPSKPITFGSMAVHHILPFELDGCPPSGDFALPEATDYIIGHSIDFDWSAAGSPKVKRIDTHAMAQWTWPDAAGYSQGALVYRLLGPSRATRDMIRDSSHSALGDCELNLLILDGILVFNPEIKTWAQLWDYSEACRIPRTCPMKRWEGVLLEDMDESSIVWCLRQDWLDPYLRKGLEEVMAGRYAPTDLFDDPSEDSGWLP